MTGQPPSTYALTRTRPPWPGVLPLGDAAAVLGLEPDTLRKRISRRQQPGYRQGARRYVVLLPAQWATWAQTYQPPGPQATPPDLESPDHPPRTAGADRAPTTGQEGVLVLLRQLEDARQREVELAGLVGYWQGRAQAAEAQLLSDPAPTMADTGPRTLTTSPPALPWWRRWLASFGMSVDPAAPRAPAPER